MAPFEGAPEVFPFKLCSCRTRYKPLKDKTMAVAWQKLAGDPTSPGTGR
jgi:hypothetical protein